MTPVSIALVAGAACTCLVGGTLAYATHEGSQPDPFAVAAAKCSLPVRQASHFGQSADVEDGVRIEFAKGALHRVGIGYVGLEKLMPI